MSSKFETNNYAPLPVTLCKGEGIWVWDTNNRRYLDMTAGLGAVSFGHANPTLTEALYEQSRTLAMCSRAFHNDEFDRFLEKICTLTDMDQAMPLNSGAEAVEAMVKAVRRYGYFVKGIPENQAQIIVMDGNYHGRTLAMTSLSSSTLYRAGFGPFLPGIISVPFNDAPAIKNAITPYTCAVLIEPIQGQAGVYIPHPLWLKQVEELCQTNNVLLAIDEVQSGLGRTGYIMAHEKEGIKADIVAFGKSLGGGLLPVSAVVGKKNVMSMFTVASHGSTFGGNPLAMRIGYESLNLLLPLLDPVKSLGEYFLKQLLQLKNVQEIRCRGLWAGLQFSKNIDAKDISLRLMHQGILAKNTSNNTIRLMPPLVITREELDNALDLLENVLNKI